MANSVNANNMKVMTSTRNTAAALLFVTAFLVFWIIMIFSNHNRASGSGKCNHNYSECYNNSKYYETKLTN